jgi:hypothetical protein
MSYDERIAARIRALLRKRKDVVERKMLGARTFVVNGDVLRCHVRTSHAIARNCSTPLHTTDVLRPCTVLHFQLREISNIIGP